MSANEIVISSWAMALPIVLPLLIGAVILVLYLGLNALCEFYLKIKPYKSLYIPSFILLAFGHIWLAEYIKYGYYNIRSITIYGEQGLITIYVYLLAGYIFLVLGILKSIKSYRIKRQKKRNKNSCSRRFYE